MKPFCFLLYETSDFVTFTVGWKLASFYHWILLCVRCIFWVVFGAHNLCLCACCMHVTPVPSLCDDVYVFLQKQLSGRICHWCTAPDDPVLRDDIFVSVMKSRIVCNYCFIVFFSCGFAHLCEVKLTILDIKIYQYSAIA